MTVVGVGSMGHGIAQTAAAAGIEVGMHDVSAEAIEQGIEAVRRNLDRGIERGKVTAEQREQVMGRLEAAPDLEESAAGSQLIVEAAPEKIELKRKIFELLDRVAPPDALLGSNTSSLSIAAIAEPVSRSERVIGMHFFNPVHLMPLLELVRAESTSDETVARALQLAARLGKEPIVVRDTPGFATSRLGLVIGLEAVRMVEQGVASPEDIDKAMVLGYRHPMGPLRLTDLVGLDVRLAIAEHLHRELDSEAFRPPALLRELVREGRLGKKSGRGFYEW
jgi:3-hydroxybutyryl-CoA dehydrogenase